MPSPSGDDRLEEQEQSAAATTTTGRPHCFDGLQMLPAGAGDEDLLERQANAVNSDAADVASAGSSIAFPWCAVLKKLAMFLLLYIGVTLLSEHYFEDHIHRMSQTLMDGIGLLGLFACVFVADGVPQPFPYAPLIFVAVKACVPKWKVFAVCALASWTAALFGYATGAALRHVRCVRRMQERHPAISELMKTKGAAGVALAASLPVPLAVATWIAGSFRISLKSFVLASCCRWPKILLLLLCSREHEETTTTRMPLIAPQVYSYEVI